MCRYGLVCAHCRLYQSDRVTDAVSIALFVSGDFDRARPHSISYPLQFLFRRIS